jgi:hypothetical protein
VSAGFGAADFDRAVAEVSAEASPEALVARLGIDWDYLSWLALDASATVLGESEERRGAVVAYGGEAFTAGFLVGAHLAPRGEACVDSTQARLSRSVDAVQVRGRHAVIADHCDLASVARIETLYADALVESLDVPGADAEGLRAAVTRIFEAGLAVGLGLSGRDGAGPQQSEA